MEQKSAAVDISTATRSRERMSKRIGQELLKNICEASIQNRNACLQHLSIAVLALF
jgi:hypothetical protein